LKKQHCKEKKAGWSIQGDQEKRFHLDSTKEGKKKVGVNQPIDGTKTRAGGKAAGGFKKSLTE